jgi:hypothetical protein
VEAACRRQHLWSSGQPAIPSLPGTALALALKILCPGHLVGHSACQVVDPLSILYTDQLTHQVNVLSPVLQYHLAHVAYGPCSRQLRPLSGMGGEQKLQTPDYEVPASWGGIVHWVSVLSTFLFPFPHTIFRLQPMLLLA